MKLSLQNHTDSHLLHSHHSGEFWGDLLSISRWKLDVLHCLIADLFVRALKGGLGVVWFPLVLETRSSLFIGFLCLAFARRFFPLLQIGRHSPQASLQQLLLLYARGYPLSFRFLQELFIHVL